MVRSNSGGPCCHCNTTVTPCWRKGPPEKPTLCNACGSRYLVKGDLVGYYPGARRNGGRTDVAQPHLTIVTKGPRSKPLAVGGKRKPQDFERYDGQALMYSDYEALENLRFKILQSGQQHTFWETQNPGTASDSSNDQHAEECFGKEYQQYLDASSDEYQEGSGVVAHSSAVESIAPSQPVAFQRRPRKQLRPVACSC